MNDNCTENERMYHIQCNRRTMAIGVVVVKS